MMMMMTLKQFRNWLHTCPTTDYLVVNSCEGLRTVNFCVIEEDDEDKEETDA
jgi:hypothetical protein